MGLEFLPFLVIPLVLSAGGAAVWWGRRRQLAWHKELARAGAQLGLGFVPAGWTTPARLEGHLDGLPVLVDTVHRSTGESSATFARVQVETGVDLRLEPEGFWTGITEAVFATDVPVGDPAFDAAVHLQGEPGAISAVFDPDARAQVAGAIGRGARHEQARWELLEQGFFGSADEVVAHVRALVAVARAVRAPTTDEALVRRVAEDPEPGVRARAAERLLDRLERAWDPAVGADVRPHLPPGRSAARLARLEGDAAGLRAHLTDEDPSTRALAAVALARRVRPGEDAALEEALRGLVGGQDPEVLAALGAIGTVASVPALRPVADRAFTTNGAHTAAREAIRAIQSRVEGAAPGALSVAGDGGGALAEVVDAVEGTVSEARGARDAAGRAAAAARRAGTPEAR